MAKKETTITASEMSKRRWAKVPKTKRSGIMSKVAKSITPEAAHERSVKAYKTRRRKARESE